MDPMTVLLSALAVAGPTLKPVTDQAVKDGYAGLKKLLLDRFGSKAPNMSQALEVDAEDPRTLEQAKQVLQDVGAHQDQEVVQKATEVLNRAEHAQPGSVNQFAEKIINIHGEFSGTLNM